MNKVGNIYSTSVHVTYSGNGYNITEESVPQLYGQFKRVCEILGFDKNPSLSTEWGYFISSLSVGIDDYRLILTSGAIDLLEPKELDFLIGHEIGHIICGHMPYHMLIETLYSPLQIGGDSVAINSIRVPMLEWYRISHYSADRAGLLACQDINVALRAMIKMSGLPKKLYNSIDVESFKEQVSLFEEFTDGIVDNLLQKFCAKFASSPWMVLRAKKLLEWYNSEDYERVLRNSQAM